MATISQIKIPPVSQLLELDKYQVQSTKFPIELKLDLNEGPPNLVSDLNFDPLIVNRYPDPSEVEQRIAAKFGVDADQVLVTAGGDEAIDRLCRAYLDDGCNMIFPTPSFEMIKKYSLMTGCDVRSVRWENEFPVEDIIGLADNDTRMVSVVSPNNPTGKTIQNRTVAQLSDALPNSILLVDQAYAEFESLADGEQQSLTTFALKNLNNAVVVRTFSKAWGMAGLRIGFILGPKEIINHLRCVGSPFSVSAISLATVDQLMNRTPDGNQTYIAAANQERIRLAEHLTEMGCTVPASQGNFVYVTPPPNFDAKFLFSALATLGVLVRSFPSENAVRITCPGNTHHFDSLCGKLKTIFQPQAILFDMDGVIVDESPSYREAILQTCRHFGCEINAEVIAEKKLMGDANNDWIFTERLLAENGIKVSFDTIKSEFERIFQGDSQNRGLWDREVQLVDKNWLTNLANRYPLGIVTGRPRNDAHRFLENAEIRDLFSAIVCMEDGPAKPAPDNVRTALNQLNVGSAWMIGDTPDDVNAARNAGILAIGIVAPNDEPNFANQKLMDAGAARIVKDLAEFGNLIP